MRASTKKFIWFFGFWGMNILDSSLSTILNADLSYYLIVLAIWLLPLMIFEDDFYNEDSSTIWDDIKRGIK